jgi:glyoxylase-like metal-dependent hydrolase (beta-lactamase superfamily II)
MNAHCQPGKLRRPGPSCGLTCRYSCPRGPGLPGLSPLADRDVIGPLRVFASPGHTPGHLSFADEERGVLLVGDCLGVVAGRLVRAPERFTADLEVAEQTLRSLLVWRGARMLFAHGPELASPWDELDTLLER